MAVADFILVFAVLLPPLFTFIFVEREQQSEKAWTMLSYSTIVSALGKVLIIFTFNPFQMMFLLLNSHCAKRGLIVLCT